MTQRPEDKLLLAKNLYGTVKPGSSPSVAQQQAQRIAWLTARAEQMASALRATSMMGGDHTPCCPLCRTLDPTEHSDNCATVYEMLDFADPPQICPKCGMYTTAEHGSDYELGSFTFNTRIMRRLASIGAELYAPLKPGDGNTSAWRWEIPELHMVGLVMPVRNGG